MFIIPPFAAISGFASIMSIPCSKRSIGIKSTDVGIASEILSENSIFDMSNFQKAIPDLEYAFQKTKKFNTSNGFLEFRTLLKDLYES